MWLCHFRSICMEAELESQEYNQLKTQARKLADRFAFQWLYYSKYAAVQQMIYIYANDEKNSSI
jgi:hypothetical protein